MEPLLRIEGLNYSYSASQDIVLKDISLQIDEGEFTAVVGPKSCGKSTLLSLVAGLLKPTTGSIFINGEDVRDSDKNIGYILQKEHLENLRNADMDLGLNYSNKLIDDSNVIIRKNQGNYGLVAFKNHNISEVADMMKQRAALICTLLSESDILLLDEPFSAFDFKAGFDVAHDIYNIMREENKTAVLVTNSLSEAISIADKVIVMAKEQGTIKNVFNVNQRFTRRVQFETLNALEFKGYFDSLCEENSM